MQIVHVMILVGLAAGLCVQAGAARAEADAAGVQLIVELGDGSRIVGTTARIELPVKSPSLGKLVIPLAELERFEQDLQKEMATMHLRSGDQLTVFLDLPRLELETVLGRVNLATENVVRITVSASPANVSNGLVAYWSFDDGKATDASGHGHYGRLCGEPRITDGIRGKAFRFDGQNDWIHGEHSPELDLKKDFSLCAWVKYSAIERGFGSQIVWYGDPTPGRDPYEIHLLPDGRCEFRIDAGSGGPSLEVRSPEPLKPDTWYFLAATVETTSGNRNLMKLYVNGELSRAEELSGVIDYDTSGMWLAIGAVDHGNWQRFHGLIDEVRVCNRPLSKSEIRALYEDCIRE
jgi:hypothetical protein